MEKTPNPKCSRCKCYWKPDETDVKSSGLVCKSCKRCRERVNKNKCEHNRTKSKCKDCSGGSICEHNKIKSSCKDCGGGSICEHNRQKSSCKDCCGSSICEHNRQKSSCKDCCGSSICEHKRVKSRCKECGGGSICEHNKRKSSCKECNFKLYLVKLQRGQIYRCFKQSTLNKTKSSIEYLGCSPDELIKIFNKKMEYFNTFLATDTIMTWDNIHIDHIKPVSSFNLDNEEEFLDCCHYTNLQPLIAVDNMEKSNKWDDNKQKFWEDNIRGNDNYTEIYI